MRFHIVYKTECLVTGKYYIGVHSTDNLDDGYLGSGKLLKLAINKYGVENFQKTILAMFDERNEALVYEKSLVNVEALDDIMCYNLCEGGGSPPKFEVATGLIIAKGDNRTEKQKEAAQRHSERMKGRKVWNHGKVGVQTAWNKGVPNPKQADRAKEIVECPHCKKQGGKLPMLKWHFDNCKFQVGA